jgi:molybdopterin synthase sulfur carrier subunit
MPVVWIPAPLRQLAKDQETVRVAGTTVREVIDQLEALFPGIRERLCEGDGLRPGLAVVVDREVSRAGLRQAVGADSEVHFLPAIAGGTR